MEQQKKTVVWSDPTSAATFRWYLQKLASILLCIDGSGSWRWCYGMEGIFLAHFELLSTK